MNISINNNSFSSNVNNNNSTSGLNNSAYLPYNMLGNHAIHVSTSGQVPLQNNPPQLATENAEETAHNNSSFGLNNMSMDKHYLAQGLTLISKRSEEAKQGEPLETLWEDEPNEVTYFPNEKQCSEELEEEHRKVLMKIYESDPNSLEEILTAYREFLENLDKKYCIKKDSVKVQIACILFALGAPQGEIKAHLKGVQNPEKTNEDENNVDIQRALYLLQASFSIKESSCKEARKWLTKCYNVQQELFENKREDYLDFYATLMGRVSLKEKKYKEAENCFLDALVLRKKLKNPRLISLSYQDLALLYDEKIKGCPNDKELPDNKLKFQDYSNKAKEYSDKFVVILAGDEDIEDILGMGPIDYRRPGI